MEFITRNQASDRPFYLQLSHYAVHLDIFYNAETLEDVKQKSAPAKKHNMPEFAAMTEDLDAGVGRILDKLIELRLLENTYVIFMSDNGGRTTIPKAPKREVDRNAPLRDGKHSFYEGGIRVPFIALGPGVKPNSVCTVQSLESTCYRLSQISRDIQMHCLTISTADPFGNCFTAKAGERFNVPTRFLSSIRPLIESRFLRFDWATISSSRRGT
jgi:phosphoglycerol transferase MdoB-like AlkP superfamily enzyme